MLLKDFYISVASSEQVCTVFLREHQLLNDVNYIDPCHKCAQRCVKNDGRTFVVNLSHSWYGNASLLLGFCDFSTIFGCNMLRKQCLFKCKWYCILVYSHPDRWCHLSARFACDYASSVLTGNLTVVNRWSLVLTEGYNLTLKYQKIQKINSPKLWFELDTFCTKIHKLIELIITVIIIKTYSNCIHKPKIKIIIINNSIKNSIWEPLRVGLLI